MDGPITAAGRLALRPDDRERLRGRGAEAVRGARRHGGPLAAVTLRLPRGADPTAIAAASRRVGEPWFSFEQADRDRFALAALGCAAAIDERGPERFARAAARWRALAERAACDDPVAPRGSGPVAVGGFAFAPDGGGAPHWAGYEPASLHVPEAAMARRGDEALLPLAAPPRPDDVPEEVAAKLEARAGELHQRPLPLLDPDPAGRFHVVSAMPPDHYEAAGARGVERIRSGALDKIVLAREVQVHAPAAHDVPAVLGVLREAFPSCHVFCAARGDGAFVAASPELLVRREGLRAGTLALAGSTRRSADPAVDDHLGEQLLRSGKDREEQLIVVRRIVRALRTHSVWVTAADEPVVVKMANIQHLATPIRPQLAQPGGAVELSGVPTAPR